MVLAAAVVVAFLELGNRVQSGLDAVGRELDYKNDALQREIEWKKRSGWFGGPDAQRD